MLKHSYSVLILFIAIFGLSPFFLLRAQTGPAGVGSSADNEVWLDAHAMGLSDGALVASWTDISGNGNSFSQGASARQPIYNASGIAGVPSLTFDGVDDVLFSGAIPDLEAPEISYFIVYFRTTTTSDMMIEAEYTSSENKFRTYSNNGQNTIISAQYSPSINWVRFTDPTGPSFFQSEITPTQISTYNQGVLEMSKPATFTPPTGHITTYLGNQNAMAIESYTYTGEMAEVLIYTSTPNSLERVMIENYLSAKYALGIPEDYFAYEATHRFGLVGIGDDGTNTQTVAQGAGELEISAPTDMTSGEYYLIAHTDHSFSTYTTGDLPAELVDHERLERTWRVSETGDVGTVTFTFDLGGDDYAAEDSYRLLVDDNGEFSDAEIITGTYLGGTLSFDVDLDDGDYFTISGIPEILEIHSITDGLWSNPSTWDCDCIPGPADEVYIDPATTVTVDIDAFAGYFKVEFTGELIMNADVTLDIKEDWDIVGLLDFTAGAISLTGDEPQNVTISATTAYVAELQDVIVENSSMGDVTFSEKSYRINGTFSTNQGNVVIDPSTTFIIASNSESDGGRVGPIISPATFTGTVTVERFIPPGLADWRDICSPVVGTTFDSWDPDLAMSGPGFPDGCAFGPDGCFRSVTFTDHSIQYDVLNSTDEIVNRRGYEVYMGVDLDTFDGTTLNSTGTLNPATDLVQNYTTGWTIMGNPYASPIAYNTLTRTGSIGNYFYVYDPASGAYEWYDGASGTASIPEITADGLMATGQAVWIYANSAGTITFNQSNKVANDATYIRSGDLEDHSLHLTLSENESTYACTIMLEERESATDGLDDALDIRHLSTGLEKAPSMAIQGVDAKIRKNFIAPDARDKSFDLFTQVKTDGYHTITLGNWAYFRDYQKILLYDHVSGETINLKTENYVFYGESESTDHNRFTLILSNAADGDAAAVETNNPEIPVIHENLAITQMGNVLEVESSIDYSMPTVVTVTNLLGQKTIYETTTSLITGKNLITLPEDLTGFYIVSLRSGEEIVSHKVIL